MRFIYQQKISTTQQYTYKRYNWYPIIYMKWTTDCPLIKLDKLKKYDPCITFGNGMKNIKLNQLKD